MGSTTSKWTFTFNLTEPITIEGNPNLANFEFDTNEKGEISGFSVSIDNLPDRGLTDETAKKKAEGMASTLTKLIVAISGEALDFCYIGMSKYDPDKKRQIVTRDFSLGFTIKGITPLDVSDGVFEKLLDGKDHDLSTLVEFTNYAIMSKGRSYIGTILCAYLAAGENPDIFKKCGLKGTRHLRNVLAHHKAIQDHKRDLWEFERLNSCKVQRNKEGFIDLGSSANLELIDVCASKMIECLRQSIKRSLKSENTALGRTRPFH